MLLLETDSIAVAALIVAVIGVLIAVPAAWGAVRAIKYAKAAPTADDLARVEGNTRRTSEHLEGVKEEVALTKQHTASTSQHLEEMKSNIARIDKLQHRQRDIQELHQRARQVHIRVLGNQTGNTAYRLEFTLKDPTSILRVELFNEQDNLFGSCNCAETDNPRGLNYFTLIPLRNTTDWFNGGVPVEMYNRRRLKLRVWIMMDDEEVYRDMAVIITDIMTIGSNPNIRGYMVEGSV
jgi:hypothetical protein